MLTWEQQRELYDHITQHARWPWLMLDIEFPYKEMLAEAKELNRQGYFIPYNKQGGYGTTEDGTVLYESLTLHGLGKHHVYHYDDYGYEPGTERQVPYEWTEVAELAPITTDFFKNKFGYRRFNRIRWQKLHPGGEIGLHTDGDTDKNEELLLDGSWNLDCSTINISLNMPKNCKFNVQHYGTIPVRDGTAWLFNNSWYHEVIHNGTEDRYHMIVHGAPDIRHWAPIIARSWKKYFQSVYCDNERE